MSSLARRGRGGWDDDFDTLFFQHVIAPQCERTSPLVPLPAAVLRSFPGRGPGEMCDFRAPFLLSITPRCEVVCYARLLEFMGTVQESAFMNFRRILTKHTSADPRSQSDAGKGVGAASEDIRTF